MLSVRATQQNHYWEVVAWHELEGIKVECTVSWGQVGKQVNYKTTVQAPDKGTDTDAGENPGMGDVKAK